MNVVVPTAFAPPQISRRSDTVMSDLLQDIRERRAEFSARGSLPSDIVARLQHVGIYRALVARRFGGDERSPAEFCRMIETIAEADGSVGWVASFGVSATYLTALPEPTLHTLYADGPDVVFAGALFPLQPARRTAAGIVVDGRWRYASGCEGASMLGVGISVADDSTGGLPRLAVLPAAQVEIVPNWDTIGLRGTGSHDLLVRDTVVPPEWTMVRGGPPSVDAAVYRYPTLALAAQVLAVVALGVARGALNEVAEIAGGRGSITGAPRLADRPYVQTELARAEANLRSARAFFYEATEAAWATVQTGAPAAPEAAALLRLAATHAARTGAEVARVAFGLAGTGAIETGHALSQAMCDAAVVAQHAFLNEGTLQSAGKVLLGMPSGPGFP